MMVVERKMMLGGDVAFNQAQTDATFLSSSIAGASLLSQHFVTKWLGSALLKVNVAAVVLGPVMLVDRISSAARPGIKR